MGDTIQKTPLEVSDGSDSTTPDGVNKAFLELAYGLELYIDDLLWRPAFHGFCDLPIELRCKIYEEYFLDDEQSLTTKTWPHLNWTHIHRHERLARQNSAPFLPRICLVCTSILKEAGHILFSALTLEFEEPASLAHFTKSVTQFCTPQLNIARCIRKLVLYDVNGIVDEFDLSMISSNIVMERTQIAHKAACIALGHLRGLYVLSLSFSVPVKADINNSLLIRPLPITVMDIGQFLNGFNEESLSALVELRKLSIFAYSGRYLVKNIFSFPIDETVFNNDVVDQLRPLSVIAQNVKNTFKARGQEVEVKTILSWGRDEVEKVTVE